MSLRTCAYGPTLGPEPSSWKDKKTMKYNVVVATHHKTGTVWMDGVFKSIAAGLGVSYIDYKTHYRQLSEPPKTPFVLFNTDSDFGGHSELLSRPDVRVLHVVRDPRDVIISAMHYHRKSNESWLHEPVPGYDDVTYQRRLKELPTKHQQYIYEMEHSSAATIHDMLGWCYDEPNCFEARYEDLRLDADMSMWRRIVTFLGFDAAERRICEESYWRNSLFGGVSRLGNKHIRSGDVGQWKREFTVPLAYVFLARFPGALQALGYESDHGWILDLQRRQPATPPSRLGQLANGGLRPLRELSRTFSFF